MCYNISKYMYKKIFFSGIGGIGMSALARYYLSEGVNIIGSDNKDSQIIQDLIRDGVNINLIQQSDNVDEDIDVFVYTLAVSDDNPELIKAKQIQNINPKLKILTYGQALGDMTNGKKTIAISGTHGKTTTTAMCFYALKNAGLNVSMIVGSLIENYDNISDKMIKTNYISHIDKNRNNGELDYIIIEACEFKKSFLNYNPDIIIITNIEEDHLDYYKDIRDIENAFQDFVNKLSPMGKLICHNDIYNKISFDNKFDADIDCNNNIDLSVPGEHNRENAKLIIKLGKVLNLDNDKIISGLKNFKGTWRRQEYKGERWGMICYDDYAHHPKELEVTIKAFRDKYKDQNKNVIISFMPHLFSRTKLLFKDFVNSLYLADKILLLPIYAAREPEDKTISSQMLMQAIRDKSIKENTTKEVLNFESIDALKEYLNNSEQDRINKDVFITFGAGDIDKVFE